MAQDSLVPPTNGSGGARYAIIGLLLLGAAVAVYFLLGKGGGSETPAAPDAGPVVERSTALATDDFDIEDDLIVDAGQPDAGEPEPTKTRVVVRRVQCNGELDQSAISRVIAQNRRQVRSCYERALKANNHLQGRIAVQLQVGSNGSVQDVAVGGNLREPTVTSCVRSLASSWTFPPPRGGCVLVNVPFSFTPRE